MGEDWGNDRCLKKFSTPVMPEALLIGHPVGRGTDKIPTEEICGNDKLNKNTF